MKKLFWVLLLPAYLHMVSCQSNTSTTKETKTEQSDHEGQDHSHDENTADAHAEEGEHVHGAGCVHGESDNEVALHRYLDKGHIMINEINPQAFNEIINTSGDVLPAIQESQSLVAGSSGIVNFNGNLINSVEATKSQKLFTISAKGFTDDNTRVKIAELKHNFNLAKSEFERAQKLSEKQLISQKEFNSIEAEYLKAKAAYSSFNSSFENGKELINMPYNGIIDQVLVQPGEYVEAGQQLAVVRKPNRVIIKADISAKYYPQIGNIEKAVITTSAGIIFDTEYFDGKRISSESTAIQDNFIPVYFEMEQPMMLPVGDYVEVALYGKTIEDAMLLPEKALMEEQGNLFVLIETGHLEFEKVYVTTGGSDGEQVIITSGIHAGDRVVVEGATIVKLATQTSSMPAETHSH